MITCPRCGEQIYLPWSGPVLVADGVIYFPQLVAVRCPRCGGEVRLTEKASR